MKTLLKFLFASISLALIFVGCDDDLQDPLESIPTVQFESSEGNVSENGAEKTVTLSFNKPFNYNASIKVLVDTAKQKYFISTPSAVNGQITIAVNKGDTKATIKLKANDNVIADGTRPILFKITRLHNEFILGEKDDYTLLIEDNEGPGHAQDSYVNFIQRNKNINESSIDWHELEVHVSNYATALGNLTIMANSVNAIYGVDYITEPALNENKFILPASGNPTVKFRIKTINDDVIGGNSTLRFTIVGVDGNLKTGTTLQDSIVVNDDELSGMPKGYEIGGSFWGLKKTYEYRSDRQISKVTWESHTPYHRTGTNTYHYNHLNELTRINKSPGHDLLYQYNDGRIVMEQEVVDGIINRYTEYDYDQAGNVVGSQTHYLQPNGEFALSFIKVLLYFPTGNLYKQLTYVPSTKTEEEPILITTETFDSYVNKTNPFPVVDVLPNVKAQKWLPTSYKYENEEQAIQYYFSYEYNAEGKVIKRTTTGPGTNEVAAYSYY